ncbi:hypothetical protein B7463_g3654, partial [Scytalidium lignicola]
MVAPTPGLDDGPLIIAAAPRCWSSGELEGLAPGLVADAQRFHQNYCPRITSNQISAMIKRWLIPYRHRASSLPLTARFWAVTQALATAVIGNWRFVLPRSAIFWADSRQQDLSHSLVEGRKHEQLLKLQLPLGSSTVHFFIKMLFNTLATSSFLVATAYAAAQPYKLVDARMSLHQVFGLVGRQDPGYSPTQNLCGPGDTCAEACGPTTVQCPTSDGSISCYDPTIGQHCCPDGTGNACDEGYFCTKDASGGTWCCPDGMDLASCAAAYSLTGSLLSETPTPSSSVAPSTSAPGSTSATTSSTTSSTSSSTTTLSTPAAVSTTTSSAPTTTVEGTETTTISPSSGTGSASAPTNGTITSLAPPPPGFTNGADANGVHGGLQALALAAGALLVL